MTMNQSYKVIWEIELDGENAREAAKAALEIQRDAFSTATVFKVIDPKGEVEWVDLEVAE